MQPWDAIARRLTVQDEVRVTGLRGSAPAWMLAGLAGRVSGPVLVVVSEPEVARTLLSELRFFLAQRERGDAAGPQVAELPAWDVTPYKGYSPSAEVQRRRIGSLHRMAMGRPGLVVAPISALAKRVLHPQDLLGLCEVLRKGEEIDRDALLLRLADRGYLSTDQCAEPGCFAVRGGVLDLFSPGHASPVRLEFWGDEIESIRSFDPWTQRSIENLDEARLLPIREEVLSGTVLEALPARLKAMADARGLSPRVRIDLHRDLEARRLLQEQELFLPLLRGSLGTVFDYLGSEGLLVLLGPEAIADQLVGMDDALHAHWSQEGCRERLVPESAALFATEEEILAALGTVQRLVLPEIHEAAAQEDEEEGDGDDVLHFEAPDHGELRTEVLAARDGPEGMLSPLVRRVRRWEQAGCHVTVVGRQRQGEQLAGLLQTYGLALPFLRGQLHRGFRWEAGGSVYLAADEILGSSRPRSKEQRRPAGHQAVGSLAQLGRGDLVVHTVHGIGRFSGLCKLRLDAGGSEKEAELRARAADPGYIPGSGGRPGLGGGSNNDYLLVYYRGDDRLYLPVHKLNLLSRYVAAGGRTPRLDKLGGQTWSKRRKKVSEDVQRIARELLELYARRQVARSHSYAKPDSFYDEFCAGFPFEETRDQQGAIDAVLEDLRSDQPMDRLVCGDVGFGKTEVAMRAAFVAVSEGKQVAVLVPTTILALQHFQAFSERMAPFGVRVELLSRFRSAAEQKVTMAGLAAGTVDVVVGTHRLLSKDVSFAELGILVVDEEHRFGVTHKERIKQIRSGVDVLTLTATPIPRTMHMALAGIRDFSVIATPPVGRRPVRTSVARFSNKRIVDAIQHEIGRGGQIFFVHNRVKTIYRMADYIQRMVPGVSIRVAHGQMSEKQLEKIMLDFFQHRFDLLLSTTIVESGIDVQAANTMIINRADRLGLAQLHQIRGRVGRSLEQGFCLMLVPPGRALRRVALERLRVIQDNSQLGSGHRIAQYDMELRGVGDLLGAKQSGNIANVGLATYMELLEAAVHKLQGREVESGPEPEVDLRAEAWIPGEYIADERDRLLAYKRLCDASDEQSLQEIFEELEDRYGHPPAEVLAFERLIELKVRCRDLRILGVRMIRGGRLELSFDATTPLDGAALLRWVNQDSRRLSFRPEGILRVSLEPEDRKRPVEAARAVLDRLAGLVAPESLGGAVGGTAPQPEEPGDASSPAD